MSQESMIASFDGTRLYLKKDVGASPKAIAVIVHGLCEHQGRYDYLTQNLAARGFGVYRFDHRGHGRSEGKRIYYRDFNDMLDDVNVIVELARQENPALPVFLIGHSMGGFAVTTYGMKYPGKVKGIVSSAGVTRMNTDLSAPPGMPPEDYFDNALSGGICSDPAVVTAYNADPLVEKKISFGLTYALAAGVAWNKANSSRFVDPVLLLHGANDPLVSEKDSRQLFGDIASKDKSLRIYAHLLHEIFNEPSKDEVIGDAIGWLEQRV